MPQFLFTISYIKFRLNCRNDEKFKCMRSKRKVCRFCNKNRAKGATFVKDSG